MIIVLILIVVLGLIIGLKLVSNHKFIVNAFKTGNVIVTGLKGTGKDIVFQNVIKSRRMKYVSNTDYGGEYIPFDKQYISTGGNKFTDFTNGTLHYYDYPLEDGTDIYLADAGVYFPSQYCNELNKLYSETPLFMALSRHLGDCSVHINVQNLNRLWDKIREMSDTFIRCRSTRVLFGRIAITKLTVYDNADSCLQRREPFPFFISNKKEIRMRKAEFTAHYGIIKKMTLVTFLPKKHYDSRVFKTMLKNGVKNEK